MLVQVVINDQDRVLHAPEERFGARRRSVVVDASARQRQGQERPIAGRPVVDDSGRLSSLTRSDVDPRELDIVGDELSGQVGRAERQSDDEGRPGRAVF